MYYRSGRGHLIKDTRFAVVRYAMVSVCVCVYVRGATPVVRHLYCCEVVC